MNSNLSILNLVLHASIVVQAVMALLRKDMAELPLSFNNFRD